MSFFRILMGIAVLSAPGLAIGQEPDEPNEEQLKILLSGVEGWNAWREMHSDVVINLSGANLSDASLGGVDLSDADLEGANLSGVDFKGANLSRANLKRADLYGAKLGGAILDNIDLEAANLNLANLAGAYFREANMAGANLGRSNLSGTKGGGSTLVGANLAAANLSNANMEGANLSEVNLSETNLEGVDFRFSDLSVAKIAPSSTPDARALVGATGLRTLGVIASEASDSALAYDIGAIVELRESAKETGLIRMERDLTCAIERIRNENPDRPIYSRLVSYCLFDLTCSYGASPDRPLFLLGGLFVGFVALYALLLSFPDGGRLYIDFRPMRKDDEISALLHVSPPRPHRRRERVQYLRSFLIQKSRFARICIYLSLQSMFNIGYREFHIGSWTERLQRRPYSMRAVGPLRVASGLQSLLGVALLALWLLCTFGRPFG